MIKKFKFFRGDNTLDLVEMVSQEVQRIARSPEHIPAGFVSVPTPLNENHIMDQGWSGHRHNLPPGQCPYDIGTPERDYWMTGWSNREDYISGRTELREIAVICTSLRDFNNWKRSQFQNYQEDDFNHTFIRNGSRYFAVMSIDSTRGRRIDDVIYTESRRRINIQRRNETI